METIPKTILRDHDARSALLRGAKEAAETVRLTLGPKGRNVLLQNRYDFPTITNDGATILERIVLKDPIEHQGALLIKQASKQTNDDAGDGTTGTAVLAYEILNKALSEDNELAIGIKDDLMEKYRSINSAREEVIKHLDKMSKKIEKDKELENVATSSVESEEHGKLIAKVVKDMGEDAFIKVEKHGGFDIEVDKVTGLDFPGGVVHTAMIEDEVKNQTILSETDVIVTNHELSDPAQLAELVTRYVEGSKKQQVIVLSKNISDNVTSTVMFNKKKGKVNIMPIQAPNISDQELEDIAVFTGATLLDKNAGMEISDFDFEYCGHVKEAVVKTTQTIFIDGSGDVKDRFKEIKESIDGETNETLKIRLRRRLGRLTGGIAVIKVGAKTDTERKYLADKFEDAVNTTQHALKTGYVPGGGMALKKIASKVSEDNFLKDILDVLNKQIVSNAGPDFKVSNTALDAYATVKAIVENACSVAGVLLTTDALVVEEEPDKLEDAIKNAVNPRG